MKKKNEHSPLQTGTQATAEQRRAEYFETGIGTTEDKLRSLMRFMGRQEVAKVRAYTELFEMTKGLVGCIADCGVFFGQGMMTYANLSAALEPYNYQCKILGFDTFDGDASHSEIDLRAGYVDRKNYTYTAPVYDDMLKAIAIYDQDRPLNHLPRIQLIKGDLVETAPKYVKEHDEVLFRIVHLSVNLYKPTRTAIDTFYPRLSRGGVIAVHGMNYTVGATRALLDSLSGFGIKSPQFRVIEYCPNVSYYVKE